jgi:CRP-like cAMP-binding protein
MVYASVDPNTVICTQGANGSYFYVIKIGNVDLYINDNFMKTLTTGDSFGDLALLHDAKRSGTIIATEYTEMWCLERKNFRNVIEYINRKNYEENKNFLQSVSILSKCY